MLCLLRTKEPSAFARNLQLTTCAWNWEEASHQAGRLLSVWRFPLKRLSFKRSLDTRILAWQLEVGSGWNSRLETWAQILACNGSLPKTELLDRLRRQERQDLSHLWRHILPDSWYSHLGKGWHNQRAGIIGTCRPYLPALLWNRIHCIRRSWSELQAL